jgi:flavin-dependent dehydrogenase
MVALHLALAGCPATLLEKQLAADHKVCGEFLSQEAVQYLKQAGVAPIELGALPINKVRLSSGRKTVEAELPFQALSLSRYVLDEALLKRAAEVGCTVRRGACVEKLTKDKDGWNVGLRDGTSMRARTVFLASGKHDLCGWNRSRGLQADWVGFKLHLRLDPKHSERLRGAIELFLFAGGYGGLSLVEEGACNFCLVVDRTRLRAAGGWAGLRKQMRGENLRLKELLEDAASMMARPLAISPIPYGYLAAHADGPWRIGDQAAVIPSFTGDGMSIALHSGALAARMFLEGKSEGEFHQILKGQLHRGMRLATWLSRAMMTSAGRMLAPLGLAVTPGAMRWIASATRIPERATDDCLVGLRTKTMDDAPQTL